MASLAKPGEQITGIVVEQIVPAMETPLLTSASKALAARRCQELGNDLAVASERVVKYPAARSADSSRISPVPSSCGAFGSRGRSPFQ